MDRGQTPKPDLTEGIRTLAIMEAIERSMETGQMVRVSEVLDGYGLKLPEEKLKIVIFQQLYNPFPA